MYPIVIKIVDTDYTDYFGDENEPIKRLIEYMYRIEDNINLPIYCYGVDLNELAPFNNDSYFELLDRLENTFINTAPYIPYSSDISPNLLHFIMSFPDTTIPYSSIFMIDSIARIFADEYPVCDSIHNDTKHSHVHYAVSTRSYTDSHNALNKDKLDKYIEEIHSILKRFKCKLILIKEDNHYV